MITSTLPAAETNSTAVEPICVGQFPVRHDHLPDAAAVAREVQAAIDEVLREHQGSVIDSERMDYWRYVMRSSRFDRSEQQAAYAAGAHAYIRTDLVRRDDRFLIRAHLVDTLTGDIHWSTFLPWEPAIAAWGRGGLRKAVAELTTYHRSQPRFIIVDHPRMDLRLAYHSPTPWQQIANDIADDITERLPHVRVISGGLAEFLLADETGQRFGLREPSAPAYPHGGLVFLRGKVQQGDTGLQVAVRFSGRGWTHEQNLTGLPVDYANASTQVSTAIAETLAAHWGPDDGQQPLPEDRSNITSILPSYEALEALRNADRPAHPLFAANRGHWDGDLLLARSAFDPHFAPWHFRRSSRNAFLAGDKDFAFRILVWAKQMEPLTYRSFFRTNDNFTDRLRADHCHDRPWLDLLDLEPLPPEDKPEGEDPVEDIVIDAREENQSPDNRVAATFGRAQRMANEMRYSDAADLILENSDVLIGDLQQLNRVCQWLYYARRSDEILMLHERYGGKFPSQWVEQTKLDHLLRTQQYQTFHDHLTMVAHRSPNSMMSTSVSDHHWIPTEYHTVRGPRSDEDHETQLLTLLRGELPETGTDWNSTHFLRVQARKIRTSAARRLSRLWCIRGRLDEALDHPLLASLWAGRAHLLALTGRHAEALASDDSLAMRQAILIDAGLFEEALAEVQAIGDDQGIPHRQVASIALALNDWDLYDEQIAAAEKRYEANDFSDATLGWLPHLVRLIRSDLPACEAWTAGYRAELMRDYDRASTAYRRCAEGSPGSLAAAESLWRLAEIADLYRGDRDQADDLYLRARAAFTALHRDATGMNAIDSAIVSPHAILDWASYRLGQYHWLVASDAETARTVWQRIDRHTLTGELATMALASLPSTERTITVGKNSDQAGSIDPIIELTLDTGTLAAHMPDWVFSSDLTIRWVGPLGWDMRNTYLQDRSQSATMWWEGYLWYLPSTIRCGHTLVWAEIPGVTQATWCRLIAPARGDADLPTTTTPPPSR